MTSWRLRLLLLLTGLSVFLSVNRRELYVGDETKYAQVIRSMNMEHSLFVPMLNGTPFTHKPPLHFWMIYLLKGVFGIDSIWSFVIPALLAYLGLMAIVVWMGRELFDEKSGVVAGFLFSSFYLIWGLAQTARMDLGFTALITLAFLHAWRYLSTASQRNLTLGGLFVGIAILLKGPMALVLLLLVLVFEAVRRRGIPTVNFLPALALAALIPLAWVVPAVLIEGRDFARELLWKQNVGRAVDSFTHKESLWYYFVHFPGTFAPWGFLVILSILAVYRRDQMEFRDPLRYCMSWFLAVLMSFTLISGKLDVYMVPAAVPLALICAKFITDLRVDSLSRWGVGLNRALTVLYALIGIALPLFAARRVADKPEYALFSDPLVRGLFISLVAVAVLGLIAQFLIREQKLLRTSIVFGLVALWPALYLGAFLVPLANEFGSTDPLIGALARQPFRGSQIALYYCPFLWSRRLPRSLSGVRYVGRDGLTRSGALPPQLLATQTLHSTDLGPRLLTDYVKVDEFRMRGKQFDVYRRR